VVEHLACNCETLSWNPFHRKNSHCGYGLKTTNIPYFEDTDPLVVPRVKQQWISSRKLHQNREDIIHDKKSRVTEMRPLRLTYPF